jgi:HlyD family secretion protein
MANAGQNRATTLLLWASGIVIIVLIVIGVRSLTRVVVAVKVVPVTYQTLASTVATNGKVEPVDEFQVHAPTPGVVKQIFVQVGQKVSQGALLVKMDDADAQSHLATARAALENSLQLEREIESGGSQEDLTRFKSELATATQDQQTATTELATRKALFQKGAASQAEVAVAQQRLDTANLTLQNAKSHTTSRYNSGDLRNAQARVADSQAAVASAENNLANIDIRSSISGSVYNIPVSQYDFVRDGDDLLDVADLNRIQVRAYFDEPEIGKLAIGQPVKIVWDAKRDEIWHGHVALVPTTIFAYGTRNVGVCIITIDDPTPDLIPNTNVTVTVTEAERHNVLSIPREALHTDGARNFVYRIVNGRLAQTTIVTGVVNLTNVEVVSGLAANDSIVLSAKSSVTELTNGLEVKQVE